LRIRRSKYEKFEYDSKYDLLNTTTTKLNYVILSDIPLSLDFYET